MRANVMPPSMPPTAGIMGMHGDDAVQGTVNAIPTISLLLELADLLLPCSAIVRRLQLFELLRIGEARGLADTPIGFGCAAFPRCLYRSPAASQWCMIHGTQRVRVFPGCEGVQASPPYVAKRLQGAVYAELRERRRGVVHSTALFPIEVEYDRRPGLDLLCS